MEMNPTASKHYLKALELVRRESYQDAIDEFQKALRHEKRFAEIHHNYSFCLYQMHKLDEAIKEQHKAYILCLDDSLPQNKPHKEIIIEEFLKTVRKKDMEVMGIEVRGIELIVEPFFLKYERYINIIREKLESYQGYFPMTYRFFPPDKEKFFEPIKQYIEPTETETEGETLLIKMEISFRTAAKWAHVYEVDNELARLSLDALLEIQYTIAETLALLDYPKFIRYGHLITGDRMIRQSPFEMNSRWFAALLWFVAIYGNPWYIVESDNEDWIKAKIAEGSKSLREVEEKGAEEIKEEALNIEKKFKSQLTKRGFDSSWGFIT